MIDTKMFAVFKSPNRVTLDDRRSTEEDISEDSQVFSDDEYMIFHNLVPGFSLNEKKWCFFYVDVVEPVQLNETAFDHLLLPEEQKRIVYALVRTHSRDNGGFDDMIKGKGKGLIFVLHGVSKLLCSSALVSQVASHHLIDIQAHYKPQLGQ